MATVRRLKDGSFQAVQIMRDTEGNELSVAGHGRTREDAYLDLDKAIKAEEIRSPGIKPTVINMVPLDRLLGIEDFEEPREPGYRKSWTTEQGTPLWVKTTIYNPGGKESTRIMDWNEREGRRRAMRAGIKAVEVGGYIEIRGASACVEGAI